MAKVNSTQMNDDVNRPNVVSGLWFRSCKHFLILFNFFFTPSFPRVDVDIKLGKGKKMNNN